MSITASPLLSPQLMAQLQRLELTSRKILRGRLQGERRGLRKGPGVELADFRNYVPGDDLRFVDWNTYARLDRLFLKLFFEEEDLHFYMLVDESSSMNFGTPTKLDYARRLAAALGFIGLVRADRVRIETLGQSSRQPAPVFRGRHDVRRMLSYLESIASGETCSLAEGVKNFCIRNPRRGIVVLISDLMDKQGYRDALRSLVGRQMDVHIVHVLSAEELEPPLRGDLKLVDCEDGDVAEISTSRGALAAYRNALASFVDLAREFCVRRGMSYVLADHRLGVERLISDYLRKRGLVG